MSREQILAAVLKNQPEEALLPSDLSFEKVEADQAVNKFIEMVRFIGGSVIEIDHLEEVNDYISTHFANQRLINLVPELGNNSVFSGDELPHDFVDVDFAIFKPHFAVAENGSVWLTEDRMGQRVLPFICQHLAMVVNKNDIVSNMHEAYQMIKEQYGFGTFIAGPSKTADIEQSLVLGAHGARSMTVFLV